MSSRPFRAWSGFYYICSAGPTSILATKTAVVGAQSMALTTHRSCERQAYKGTKLDTPERITILIFPAQISSQGTGITGHSRLGCSQGSDFNRWCFGMHL